MKIEIIPFVKVGDVDFQMSVEDVIKTMNEKIFDKTDDELGVSLTYYKLGRGFFFQQNRLVNMTCFLPCSPILDGMALLGLDYNTILDKFKGNEKAYIDDDILYFPHYGLGFAFEEIENSSSLPSSIHISNSEYVFEFIDMYDEV